MGRCYRSYIYLTKTKRIKVFEMFSYLKEELIIAFPNFLPFPVECPLYASW